MLTDKQIIGYYVLHTPWQNVYLKMQLRYIDLTHIEIQVHRYRCIGEDIDKSIKSEGETQLIFRVELWRSEMG